MKLKTPAIRDFEVDTSPKVGEILSDPCDHTDTTKLPWKQTSLSEIHDPVDCLFDSAFSEPDQRLGHWLTEPNKNPIQNFDGITGVPTKSTLWVGTTI